MNSCEFYKHNLNDRVRMLEKVEVFRGEVERLRKSRVAVLVLVYLALVLDNMLLTVVVPIIPDYLYQQELEQMSRQGSSYTDNNTTDKSVLMPSSSVSSPSSFTLKPSSSPTSFILKPSPFTLTPSSQSPTFIHTTSSPSSPSSFTLTPSSSPSPSFTHTPSQLSIPNPRPPRSPTVSWSSQVPTPRNKGGERSVQGKRSIYYQGNKNLFFGNLKSPPSSHGDDEEVRQKENDAKQTGKAFKHPNRGGVEAVRAGIGLLTQSSRSSPSPASYATDIRLTDVDNHELIYPDLGYKNRAANITPKLGDEERNRNEEKYIYPRNNKSDLAGMKKFDLAKTKSDSLGTPYRSGEKNFNPRSTKSDSAGIYPASPETKNIPNAKNPNNISRAALTNNNNNPPATQLNSTLPATNTNNNNLPAASPNNTPLATNSSPTTNTNNSPRPVTNTSHALKPNNTSPTTMGDSPTRLPEHIINENGRVGLLFSSKALVQLLVNPFIGPLTSHVGYSLPLVVGTHTLIVSALLYAYAESYTLMFVARSLQGVASSLIAIAGMGMVAECYPDDSERGRMQGLVMGGIALGVLAGYPLGSLLYDFTNSKTPPFLLVAALTVVLAVAQLTVLNPRPHPEGVVDGTPLSQLVRDPYILVTAGAIMVSTSTLAVLEPCLPIWLTSTLHPQKWQLGTAFLPDSLGYLVGTSCTAGPAFRLGRWRVALVALIMVGLAAAAVPEARTMMALALPHLLLGLGVGTVDAALMPHLAALVDARHVAAYGAVYAVAQAAVALAYFLGPLVGGAVVESIGFPWLMRAMAVLNFCYCPFLYYLASSHTSHSSEPETQAILMSAPRPQDYTMHTTATVQPPSHSALKYTRLFDEDD
ncbi:hypothetical protein Pmani_025716 [Petrolisthes manimaculis]|uniref:Major facilitator superfamily (MFS) profile domain-containing protein n=1 Tax=Petrolisthes manimaculis TaxID=1843537 RepID=A0AAE1P7P3_9EUCA|nr:hypothetical protein Pmani_025716 [Petrolisthes manimaculis]